MRLVSPVLLLGLLVPPVAVAEEPTRTFDYDACSFSLDYPADMVAAADEALADECGVTLRPADMKRALEQSDGIDVHTSYLSRPAEPFLVAADMAGFDFRNGEWITVGRMEIRGPAEPYRRGRWSGIHGVLQSGCSSEAGHAGLCEYQTYVLSDDDGLVLVLELAPSARPDLAAILIDGFRGEERYEKTLQRLDILAATATHTDHPGDTESTTRCTESGQVHLGGRLLC